MTFDMRFKIQYLFILSFLLGYYGCFAQQNPTTSYKSTVHSKLNLVLNGSVQSIKLWSNSDSTIISDTIYYVFTKEGFPENIIETYKALIHSGNGKTVHCFESGNLVSVKYYEDNNLLSYKNYKYDYIGNLIERSDYLSNNSDPYYIENYQYNKNRQLINYSMDNLSGNIFHKWVYTYDIVGNKIEEGTCENYEGINKISDCKYKALHGYRYNKKGLIEKKFNFGKWSPHNTDIYYQYDENGNEIDTKGYHISSDTVLGYHYVYQYDKSGNMIIEEERVGNNRHIEFDNYKFTKNQYDTYNNIIQQELLTSENKILMVIKFNYVYDKYGNWIKREKLEGKSLNDLVIIEVDERLIEYY